MNDFVVDFLPADYRERRGRRRYLIGRCLVALGLLAGIGAHAWVVHRDGREARAHLGEVLQRYQLALGRIAEVEQLELKKSELENRLAVLKDVLERARGAEVFHAVGRSCPESTALQRLELRVDESGGRPRVEVSIEGVCPDNLEVAMLMSELSAEPLIANFTLVRSEKVDAYRDDKRFVITAQAHGRIAAGAAEDEP